MYQGKRRFHLSEADSVQLTINLFYLVGLGVVGTGQVTGLYDRLGLLSVGAALIIELGGVTFARIADFRRRLGEKAIAARLLSAAFAALSVGVNWFCHIGGDPLIAYILACLSGLLYVVFLINSEFRRRDELRRKRKLPPSLPAYGWNWITRPRLTRRAADMFRRDPRLGLYGSLDKAIEERRTADRRQAMHGVAKARMTKALGPHETALIMSVTDPDEFAQKLTAQVNVDGHIAVLARRAAPEILEASMARDERNSRRRSLVVDAPRRRGFWPWPARVVDPTNQPTTPAVDPTTRPDQPTSGRPTNPTSGRAAKPTRPKPTTRPKAPVVGPTNPTNHADRAVQDAATARLDFPDGLPPGRGEIRVLRDTYRWSNDRAKNALAAYTEGADLEVLVGQTNPTTDHAGGGQ